MRKQFCEGMVERAAARDMVFLTGDLGFMALEPLAAALGRRFVNAGVSEQNMIGVAAALCREGFETWVYSIAPFCYARPFEQIRNDICFHRLPVRLVGNGGGYGYGVMGPTHHAIEDYGVLLTLEPMRVFVPVFEQDVGRALDAAAGAATPAYLRLGRAAPPGDHEVPGYAPWRRLLQGDGDAVVVAVGPLAAAYIGPLRALPADRRPDLWAVAELPCDAGALPAGLVARIRTAATLCVAEEHVARGGFGHELAALLMSMQILPRRFVHLHALSHVFARYGSEAFLRSESRLDAAALLGSLEQRG